MNSQSQSVALLLFSLSATEEARCKPMAGSFARGERVWQSLDNLTVAKLKATGLPTFVSHRLPARLRGSFGQQLRQAAQAVLDQGYTSVICVGNDCPALRPADLREAARLLQSGVIPVGMDKRGGVYLAGFTRQSLADENALVSLPWNTGSLAPALLTYLHQRGEQPVLLSAQHADWNTRFDVRLTEAIGVKRWLCAIHEAFFAIKPVMPPVSYHRVFSGQPALVGLRAPPVLA